MDESTDYFTLSYYLLPALLVICYAIYSSIKHHKNRITLETANAARVPFDINPVN